MKRHWPRIRLVLQVGFVLLVLGLLASEAKNVDWQKVRSSMANYAVADLAWVMLLVIASYAMFMNFDRLAKRYTGHGVSLGNTLLVSFICYTFNFNLGSLVGGAGLRIKLYSQLGERASAIAKIFGFCVLSNWLGYLVLLGILLAFHLVSLPAHQYNIGALGLRGMGFLLLAVALIYAVVGTRWQRQSLEVRGHSIDVPSRSIMIQQFVISLINWMLMGAMVYVLLGKSIDYSLVLGTFLISSIVGVVTHVPAGLGVLEAVFIVCLAGKMSREDIIAGLIAYRACFYFIPFCIAAALYSWLEWKLARQKHITRHPDHRAKT